MKSLIRYALPILGGGFNCFQAKEGVFVKIYFLLPNYGAPGKHYRSEQGHFCFFFANV